MQTSSTAVRSSIMSPVRAAQPLPSARPSAEYVLIGPSHDLDEIARMFAELDQPVPLPHPADPHITVEIPTIRVRVWSQPDGSRIVEVHDHRGESVAARTLASIFRR